MPRIHPRELPTNKAENELSLGIHRIIEEYELTDGEALRVVTGALSSWLRHFVKITIREERHGNSETPGGWAPEEDEKSG